MDYKKTYELDSEGGVTVRKSNIDEEFESFEEATTDDLTEGNTNLYYTSTRAINDSLQNVIGGTDIQVSYSSSTDKLTIDFTGNGGTGSTVQDSGSPAATGVSTFNFNSNLSVTDDGGGQVTINATDTDTTYTGGTDITISGTTIDFDNTSGYITDYSVTQADVTQYETALTITESQISDLSHYTSSDFDTDFGGKTTDNLSEGSSNLYYTSTRFDSDFSSKTTTALTEGINLYYTDERAQDGVFNNVVNGTYINSTYDDGAGTLTINSTPDQLSLVNISSNTTTSGDSYYSVDSSVGEITITLATADAENGRAINVKRNGNNNVVIVTEGSETIDNASSATIGSDNNAVTLVYNNSNSDWEIY